MRMALFFLLSLGGCSGEETKEKGVDVAPDAAREHRSKLHEPKYGPIRPMQGIFTSGFESSSFTQCGAKHLDSCGEGPAECWFVPTEKFSRQFEAAVPAKERDDGGVFYIRFFGKQANNGAFGHLNGSTCQVRGITLTSAEPGLP